MGAYAESRVDFVRVEGERDEMMSLIQRKARVVVVAIGCSLGLFGCIEVEQRMTVLEDGQIIDRIQLSPKRSL